MAFRALQGLASFFSGRVFLSPFHFLSLSATVRNINAFVAQMTRWKSWLEAFLNGIGTWIAWAFYSNYRESLKFNFLKLLLQHQILVSIVVSIPACHAGDRGSIPRRGGFIFTWTSDFLGGWKLYVKLYFLAKFIVFNLEFLYRKTFWNIPCSLLRVEGHVLVRK